MLNNHENLKNNSFFSNRLEKEKEPRKVIVFIRHPEQDFKVKQSMRLAKDGEDINTYSLITANGLKQLRQLSEYLEKDFPWKISDREYSIYSSPIKRAQRGADILETNIRLKIADGIKIPIPVNNNRNILECFSEIIFATDIATDEDIIRRAKMRKIKVVDAWLDMEGENLLPRFQNKLNDIREGFFYLEQQPTKLDIVLSHGLTIATIIWTAQNPEKFKNIEYKLTMNDLKEIVNYSKNIPCTSITEFSIDDNGISLDKIGETPHLKKENNETII